MIKEKGEKMSKKKKIYSAEFKAKVVLELLREEEPAAKIASRYGITVQTLNQWKKKFLENASLAFDIGSATKEYKAKIEKQEKENEALAKTLGKTTIERDWAVGKLKSLDLSSKKSLVDSKLNNLSMTRHCELLQLNRSTFYYESQGPKIEDICIMHRIDAIYTDSNSTYGYRRIHAQLKEERYHIGHNRVYKLMGLIGIKAIYSKRKKTKIPNWEHRVYPYALKDIEINRANQFWSGDITYIPIKSREASCIWLP